MSNLTACKRLFLLLLLANSFLVCWITVSGQSASKNNAARLVEESGFIDTERQSVRLDYFWRELEKEQQSSGYIVGCNEKDFPRGQFLRRIYGNKSYLERTWVKDSHKIFVLDNGYCEKLTIQLWVAPKGSLPPTNADAKIATDNRQMFKFDSECMSCEPPVFIDLPIPGDGLAFYAEALKAKPGSQAIIILYPNNYINRNVLKRAKAALTKKYKIDKKRVTTEIGELRDTATLELWIKGKKAL